MRWLLILTLALPLPAQVAMPVLGSSQGSGFGHYLDAVCGSGSDSNSGALGSPWATLTHACSALSGNVTGLGIRYGNGVYYSAVPGTTLCDNGGMLAYYPMVLHTCGTPSATQLDDVFNSHNGTISPGGNISKAKAPVWRSNGLILSERDVATVTSFGSVAPTSGTMIVAQFNPYWCALPTGSSDSCPLWGGIPFALDADPGMYVVSASGASGSWSFDSVNHNGLLSFSQSGLQNQRHVNAYTAVGGPAGGSYQAVYRDGSIVSSWDQAATHTTSSNDLQIGYSNKLSPNVEASAVYGPIMVGNSPAAPTVNSQLGITSLGSDNFVGASNLQISGPKVTPGSNFLVSSCSQYINSGTPNLRFAIWNDSGGSPLGVLTQPTTTITGIASSWVTQDFSALSQTLSSGSSYWLGSVNDVTYHNLSTASATIFFKTGITFPTAQSMSGASSNSSNNASQYCTNQTNTPTDNVASTISTWVSSVESPRLASVRYPALQAGVGTETKPYMGQTGGIACPGGVCPAGLNGAYIESTCDKLVSSGLLAAGYDTVIIDAWWGTGSRNGSNQIIVDSTRFPSGMASVVSYCHADGVKVGLYYSLGTTSCNATYIPPSNTFESIDMAQAASFGIDQIRADNCTSYGSDAAAQSEAAAFGAGIAASGRAMTLSLSEANTDDLYGSLSWCPTIGGADSYSNKDLGLLTWSNLVSVVNNQYGLAPFGSEAPLCWQQPANLLIGSPAATAPENFTADEAQTNLNLWAIFHSPLVLNYDITDTANASRNTIALESEVIALAQNAAAKVGTRIQSTSCGGDTCYVYYVPSSGAGNAIGALLFVNGDSAAHTISVNFSVADLPASTYSLRDVVTSTNLGSFTTSYTTGSLASHASQLVALCNTTCTAL